MNIGIDIGGTHIRVGRGEEGKIEKKLDFPTGEFNASINQIIKTVRQLSNGAEKVGVACPGPIETKTGRLGNLPNLPTFRHQPLKEILKQKLNLAVAVDHDASLAALAEARFGAGKGKDPVLYYTVSTGLGAGLVQQGKIYHGVYNPEPGQQIVTGVNQNLEKIASGTGLREFYGKDPAELVGTAEWDKALERLARGITNSILHYSPRVVIIGGGLIAKNEIFFKPLVERIEGFLTIFPLPEILKPAFGEDSTLIGAFELASSQKTD